MVAERLEVRLDVERQRKLRQMAEERGASISEVVRSMIDREYEASMRDRRIEAVRRLMSLEIEDVTDPETLSRQLAEAHDPGVLY